MTAAIRFVLEQDICLEYLLTASSRFDTMIDLWRMKFVQARGL